MWPNKLWGDDTERCTTGDDTESLFDHAFIDSAHRVPPTRAIPLSQSGGRKMSATTTLKSANGMFPESKHLAALNVQHMYEPAPPTETWAWGVQGLWRPAEPMHEPETVHLAGWRRPRNSPQREFIDYTTSMITDQDPLRGLLFY